MGLSDDFLWGGATAANQAEGGVLAGGRGLSNVDLLPTGPDRAKVAAGELEMLEWQEDSFYPAQTAIDMYHHYMEDIALLPKWVLTCIGCHFLGQGFFQMAMTKSPTKKACFFMRKSSKN